MAVAPSLTSTGGLSSLMATIYDKQLLHREKQELVYEQLAWNKELAHNMGNAIRFQAYRPLAIVTSALSEGSASGHTEYALTSRDVTVTPEEWGATAPISTLYSLTKLDPGLVEQIDIVADQRNRSIDRQLAEEVGQNCIFPMRGDQDSNFEVSGIRLISANASTTQFRINTADDAIGAVTSLGAGSPICVTAGTNYGYAGRVSNTSTSGATGMLVTLRTNEGNRAAVSDFDSTSVIRVMDQQALAATDVLSSTNLRGARKHLRKNRAPFYDGGTWTATVSPDTEYDFLGDSTFVLTSQYAQNRQLYNGEVGMWMGIRFVATTAPFRETILGVTDMDGGALTQVQVFGRKAFGVGKITGGSQGVVVLQGATKSDPLNMVTTVGWKSIFQARGLTAPHCVSIFCGATGL